MAGTQSHCWAYIRRRCIRVTFSSSDGPFTARTSLAAASSCRLRPACNAVMSESGQKRRPYALAIVAAFVRLNTLEILFTPALDFAIVFNVRTSSFDQARLTTFFFFGISFPSLLRTALCITASFIDDLIFGKVV